MKTLEELRDYINDSLSHGKGFPVGVRDIATKNEWVIKGQINYMDDVGRILKMRNGVAVIYTPTRIDRAYVTEALTNERCEIFSIIEDCDINDWSYEGNAFYLSEVLVDGSMYMVLKRGRLLVNPTNEELSSLHEQSKINLHQ